MTPAVASKKKSAVRPASKAAARPSAKAEATPAYKNCSLPSARRVKDLMSRMTLEEKAAQMLCMWQEKAQTLVDAKGNFDPAKAKKNLRGPYALSRGLGQVGRPSDAGGGRTARQMAELTNAIQRFFLENSRLGIPVIFHEECLHGNAAPEGTSFPQPIALGGTFNPKLVEELFTMTAVEAGARGRDVRRGSVPGVAHGDRGGEGLPGRRELQGQDARAGDAETFCRAWTAGIGHELRSGERVRAGGARDVSLYVSRSAARGRCRDADGQLQRD